MARRSDHSRDELRRMVLNSARNIVTHDGLRGLSTRRIAKDIGYSAGTLYQLFDDLDDLIVHLNAETLGALFQRCQGVNYRTSPEAGLQELAQRYIRFVCKRRNLWNAIFEHNMPTGRVQPAWYTDKILDLLGLVVTALSPLFSEDDRNTTLHEARVLWASLYGIASLASSGKLARTERPEAMVRSLITNYVGGLRVRLSS